ncbi:MULTISPECIES: putative bifunctional diguanylate cyclase/phosphodiesterase [unclassified Mycobacterium]|uniref:putative bifunctional diguanylate cyclase/phosphodiesterase n=1 Tax=unclassified Mycobacterium TaxID=2642494 RepID=UPI0029C6C105|nr:MULTISPECIES: EAL domain-containing protein [unclassified Mycobacterium]
MRRIAWAVGIPTAAAIAVSAWLIAGWGGESTLLLVCNYGSLAFAMFATVGTGLAAWSSHGRKRISWAFLTVAVGGWTVGSAIWTYYEFVLHASPFPSPADAAYLLFPIAACVGLAIFPTGYSGHSYTRLVLDGLIVAAALFEISWVLVLQSVYDAGGDNQFALALSMAYPVGDLMVITVAVMVLVRGRNGQRRTLTLLTAGVIAMALSDSAFVYQTAHDTYRDGGFVDVGWIAGVLLIGIAGLLSYGKSMVDVASVKVPSRSSLWLPYVPIALAAAVCGPMCIRMPGLGALFMSSTVLIVAVLARQYFVVNENRKLLEVVADQALRDPLTGLSNRALFNDRLTHAMQLHQRDRQSVAVLSLDLDDFKLVNDSLGHPAGDQMLVLVAERLLGCVRTGDTVARVGGDEFAVLMEGNAEHSRLIAHRVLQAFDELFIVDGHDLLVRPSIGLAVARADQVEISADELLKQADVAMYSAKRSRTGGVHTFDPEMHLVDTTNDVATTGTAGHNGVVTVRLLGQLRHAIDHVGLSLVYQPKFDLRDGDVVGVEALVRWPHPERGLLGPDEFLPLVREHGLMRSLTDFVLGQALDDAAQWRSDGVGVPVAVNVFAPSLCDLKLPDRILQALEDRDLNPELLTIEITEDLLLDNLDRTRTVLERLRAHGMRVAIDDFGSGYSTLSYLCELPIDEVKLDRQFIAPILVDRRAAAVVRAVVDLAHDLDLTTVAEGVENAATAARLREYGCEVAQGFHYSAPLEADALRQLLSRATTKARV